MFLDKIEITLHKTLGQVMSARELHEYLEVKTKFTEWIKYRIQKYDFVENTDFGLVSEISETNNSKNPTTQLINYMITIDMAKELSMIENNDKGKEARKYFIQIEKEYHLQVEKNLLAGAMLMQHADKIGMTTKTLYPILDKLGVIKGERGKIRYQVHQEILRKVIGKYENINQYDKLPPDFIEKYREVARDMKANCDKRFWNEDQISFWDMN